MSAPAPAETAVVDAHVHVWNPEALAYPWLAGAAELDRPMLPAAVDRGGELVTGAVFVEADCAPGHALDEVHWVAGLNWPQLRGIVAAADLRAPGIEAHLDALAETGRVVGIRHSLQDEDAARWHDDAALVRGLRAVAARGWSFDACVRWPQLGPLTELLARLPELAVVLDHLGKPPVDAGYASAAGSDWATALAGLAAQPGVAVKLSGLAAEAHDAATLARHGDAFIARGIELFGAQRAMIGSDWPVSARLGAAVSTADWIAHVAHVAQAGGADWAAIAHGTAERVYRLPPVGRAD